MVSVNSSKTVFNVAAATETEAFTLGASVFFIHFDVGGAATATLQYSVDDGATWHTTGVSKSVGGASIAMNSDELAPFAGVTGELLRVSFSAPVTIDVTVTARYQ